MALLLAGISSDVPGITVNRLCSSGLNAVGLASQAIKAGEIDFAIAGGVESMTRAPFVMGKAQEAFSRSNEVFDTTIGWRFVNPLMKAQYGVDQMADTAENVAEEFQVARKDQDAFALRSQQRAGKAMAAGYFSEEIVAGRRAGRQGAARSKWTRTNTRVPDTTCRRRWPSSRRRSEIRALSPPATHPASNDGAAAMIVASERAVKQHGLTPRASILGMASAGVPPRIMGMGPVPSTRKLMERLGIKIGDFDVIELNEAFAAQALACLRQLGLPDDAEHVNPNGGAIALGHPLGMSGARLALTALHQLERTGGKARLPPCASVLGRAFRSRSSECDQP